MGDWTDNSWVDNWNSWNSMPNTDTASPLFDVTSSAPSYNVADYYTMPAASSQSVPANTPLSYEDFFANTPASYDTTGWNAQAPEGASVSDYLRGMAYPQPVGESGGVYSGYTDGVPAAESGTSWLGQKAGDLMSGAGDVITHPVSTLEEMGRWMRDNPNAASLVAGTFSLLPAYLANIQNRRYQDEQLRLAQEARAAKQAATASDRVRLADIMSAKSDPRVRKAATVGTHYARSGSATPGEVEHFSNNAPSIVRAASGGSVSDGCPHCGGLAAYARGGSLGQADDVPAMLSHGEFVVPADVVAHLGDGNNEAGAVKLHRMMSGVRQQKISGGTKLPPVAKDPMTYMRGKKNG